MQKGFFHFHKLRRRTFVPAILGVILASSFLLTCVLGEAAPRSPGLILEPQVMTALNRVLAAGDSLQKSLVAQSEDEVEIGIRDLINQLDQARAATSFCKPHERGHLLLVLDAAREQFERTQTAYGDERTARLVDGYNQLANIVRVYQIERSYSIFFCPDDKTSWVQKGMHGQNPFHPKSMLNCGIRVVNR